MIQIDKELISDLFDKAVASERKRMNFDLRTSGEDGGQRMLNALLPGTSVPVHLHPMSAESVILLTGRIDEVFYDVVDGGVKETARYHLDPANGVYGCQVPAGVWHTVEVFEPSVIFESKDGRYGHDGSESL